MKATMLLLLLVPGLALAGGPGEDIFAQRLETAQARLHLSEAQLEQIEPILRSSFEAQAGILEQYGIDPEQPGRRSERLGPAKARSLAQEMRAVRADTRRQLEPVLTEEQLAEYDALQQERRAAMRERLRQGRDRG